MTRRRVPDRQPPTKDLTSRPPMPVTDSRPAASRAPQLLIGSAAILVAAVASRWWFFDVREFQGDELVYIHYATRISAAGVSQFRALAVEYASNSSLWVFPNPLRVLYILVTALACRVAGACSGPTIAAVSFLSGIGLVLLTLIMAQRMFGGRVALLSGLLVAFSPLQLALSRRAWQDGLFSLFVLLALWAFWERSRSQWNGWDILLGGSLVAALLIKESAVILLMILLAFLAGRQWLGNRALPRARSVVAALLLPLPLAACLLFLLIPDLSLLIRVYRGWLGATQTGPYAIAYSQGPWFRYLIDFVLLSPVTILLAIGSYFRPGSEQEDRFLGRSTLFLFVAFSLVALKNVRYVSFLDLPIRILAALTLISLPHHPIGTALRGWGPVIAVFLLAAYDLSLFHSVFISGGVYDPVTAALAKAERLIP